MWYEAGLVGTIVLCLWTAVDTARSTSPQGRRAPIVLLGVAVGCWAAGELGVWRADTPEGVRAARRLLYAGTAVVPMAWVWAAADAAHLRALRATPLRLFALAAPSLAAWALLWTPFADVFVHPSARPPRFGPLFLPYVAYTWLLVLAGTAGFLAAARRVGRAEPLRIGAIVLGSFGPLIGNGIFLGSDAVGMDPTPICVGAGVVLIRLSVFDAGLAAFLPVARRDVIEQLDAGVLVADLEGVVVDANSAARRLVAAPGVEGMRLDEAIASALRDPARAIEVRRAPVAGRHGVVGAFAVLTDRTESRRLEQQLVLAHKLEALGVLTAGIAHEVNNPLAFVRANLGGLQELADGLRDPRLRAALPEKLAELAADAPDLAGEAIEGVERIGRLVRRLRRFARTGEASSERGPVALEAVAEKARALAGVGLPADAIQCRAEPAPPVWANEDELVQIAVNLLVNAIQATRGRPAPSVEEAIGVEVEVTAARGGGAIVVRDRGPGIDEQALPRLFDPFFTTKPPGEGTGLGLSLSFDLAQRSGGSLSARNRPGGGAEFELWLPAATDVAAGRDRAGPHAS